MKEIFEKTISVNAEVSKLNSNDVKTLEAEFYSECDIKDIERNFDKVRFTISFFDNLTPQKSFKKDLTAEEAEVILSRKNFISAVAQAITDQHHFSVSRIYTTNGTIFLTCLI